MLYTKREFSISVEGREYINKSVTHIIFRKFIMIIFAYFNSLDQKKHLSRTERIKKFANSESLHEKYIGRYRNMSESLFPSGIKWSKTIVMK